MSAWQSVWRDAANDVLSVLVNSPDAWKTAVLERGLRSTDFPDGVCRKIYMAILDLRGQYEAAKNQPPSLPDTEVAARAGVDTTAIDEIIILYDAARVSGFDANCKLLADFGRGSRQANDIRIANGDLLTALAAGKSTDTVIETLITNLRTEDRTVAVNRDILSLVEAIESDMNKPPVPGLPLGIPVLDQWQRGAEPGENIILNGARKDRKTTVAANILLYQARHEKNITFISLDEVPKRFAQRLIVMLIAEWFWKNDYWNVADERNGLSLNIIDRKMLTRAGENWKNWHPLQREAYAYAITEAKKLKRFLRIYGPADGVKSLAGLRQMVMFDRAQYGVDMFGLDHIQKLIDEGSDTYKKIELASATLQMLGVELGIPSLVLSQKNNEAIRASSIDDGLTGAKGGGGIDSNADAIYEVLYNRDKVKDPKIMRLVAKLCRDAPTPAYQFIEIHPESGWITPRVIGEAEAKQIEAKWAARGGDDEN